MIQFRTGRERIIHAFLHGLHPSKPGTTSWLAACGREMHWTDSKTGKSKRKLHFLVFGPNRLHKFWPKKKKSVTCTRCCGAIDNWLKSHEPVMTDGLKRRMLMQRCLRYLIDGVPEKKNTRLRRAMSRFGLLPKPTHCERPGCGKKIPDRKEGPGRTRKSCSPECAWEINRAKDKEYQKRRQLPRGDNESRE